MNNKQMKGLNIAKTQRILKRGHEWIVPSQSGRGNYAVTMNMEGRYPFRRCTCPDYELSRRDRSSRTTTTGGIFQDAQKVRHNPRCF